MRLENHIVNRLLTDDNFPTEIVITQSQEEGKDLLKDGNAEAYGDEFKALYHLLTPEDNRTYYVTNSVLDRLELLDTKKAMQVEGWQIFKSVPDFKKTFILPDGNPCHDDNRCLRVQKKGNMLYFCHISFKFHPKHLRTRMNDGNMKWVLLWVDMDKKMCEHFESEDGKQLAPFLYTLMCFVELCDNEVVIVQPKAKYGTQKTGKIINVLPFPITVINNNWNVMTIRSEGFTVSGHAHIYWTGPGRTIPKLLYVEPYQKEGYTRRSGKQLQSA